MSGKQKTGYILSLSFAIYLACSVIGAIVLNVEKPANGFSKDQIDSVLWIIAGATYLQVVKSVRIKRSKQRCPDGMKELTLGEQRWQIKSLLIGVLFIFAGAAAMYFGRADDFLIGFIIVIAGLEAIYVSLKLRWQPVVWHQQSTLESSSNTFESSMTPITPSVDDDWSRKHGF